jgi:hypothetical protein
MGGHPLVQLDEFVDFRARQRAITFVPRPSGWHDNVWESRMRLILGIIIGGALTIGGAYVADKTAGAQPMVNWDVVGKNVSNLTGMARDGWKKITG